MGETCVCRAMTSSPHKHSAQMLLLNDDDDDEDTEEAGTHTGRQADTGVQGTRVRGRGVFIVVNHLNADAVADPERTSV